MKIDVGQGGERFLPWARRQVDRLRGLRKELGLPRLAKRFKAADATIDCVSSEGGDLVRIRAGALDGRAYPWLFGTTPGTSPSTGAAMVHNLRVKRREAVDPAPEGGTFSGEGNAFCTFEDAANFSLELQDGGPSGSTSGVAALHIEPADGVISGTMLSPDNAHMRAAMPVDGKVAARRQQFLETSKVLVLLKRVPGVPPAPDTVEQVFVPMPPQIDALAASLGGVTISTAPNTSQSIPGKISTPAFSGNVQTNINVVRTKWDPYTGKVGMLFNYRFYGGAETVISGSPNTYKKDGTERNALYVFDPKKQTWSTAVEDDIPIVGSTTGTSPPTGDFGLTMEAPNGTEVHNNWPFTIQFPIGATKALGLFLLTDRSRSVTSPGFYDPLTKTRMYRNGVLWRDDFTATGEGGGAATLQGVSDAGGAVFFNTVTHWQTDQGTWTDVSSSSSSGWAFSPTFRYAWRRSGTRSRYYERGAVLWDSLTPTGPLTFVDTLQLRWSYRGADQFHCGLSTTAEATASDNWGVFTMALDVEGALVLKQKQVHPEKLQMASPEELQQEPPVDAQIQTNTIMLDGYYPE